MTTVLPAARAGPILLASVMIGEFHGMSAAMTPSGSRVVNATLPGSSSGTWSPRRSRQSPEK